MGTILRLPYSKIPHVRVASRSPRVTLAARPVRSADGRLRCAECERAERGIVAPDMDRPDVPITQPNTNFPNTH